MVYPFAYSIMARRGPAFHIRLAGIPVATNFSTNARWSKQARFLCRVLISRKSEGHGKSSTCRQGKTTLILKPVQLPGYHGRSPVAEISPWVLRARGGHT